MATMIEQFAQSLRQRINAAIDEALEESFGRTQVARQGVFGPRPATPAKPAAPAKPARQRRPAGDTWIADPTQRGRVPFWVLEATQLPDKKAIVAKFGAGASFAKGQPVPARSEAAAQVTPIESAARTVKAKPPIRRRPGK